MPNAERPIGFLGGSLADLKVFADDARQDAGYQLGRVQYGAEPEDWKPMPDIGPGAREIRVREASGAFRILYVAKFEEAIYVLHCFQKKTQKTAKRDLEMGKTRYRDMLEERRNG